MKTTDEYKASVSEAIAFKHDHPDEKAATAARIYHVNDYTVQTNLQRERIHGGVEVKHRGHNKILSDTLVEAIYKYVEDSYLSGYSATKAMVYAAIGCLKANQLSAKEPPSWRWFQIFMKEHPQLFQTLKTKAIAQVHVTAADVEEVKDWFNGFCTWCKEHDIQPRDVLNFNEAGFQVGVAPGEEIVVPAYVKEVSILFREC
jgi:DNA gyrase inhibitor GyrI